MSNSFGRQFRKLQEAKGISQWQLSRKLGYATNSYISTVEKGTFIPSQEKLKEIARAVGVPFSSIQEWSLDAKLGDLGIKEPFISMFKDYPQLTQKDKEAISKAYLGVKEAQKNKHVKHRQKGK